MKALAFANPRQVSQGSSMGLCVRSPYGCRADVGGRKGLPSGSFCRFDEGAQQGDCKASALVACTHRSPSPVFECAGAVTVVASRVDPAEGWGAEPTLSRGGVSVASANRRRLEWGLCATFARQVRFRCMVSHTRSRSQLEGWREDLVGGHLLSSGFGCPV